MLIIILETVNLCRSGYLNGRELGMTMIQQSKPRVITICLNLKLTLLYSAETAAEALDSLQKELMVLK